MLEFEKPELTELKPRITVIGVGGDRKSVV